MADVFISYKREDRPRAERLSIVLEQLGFEVWWDFDLLSGDRYRSVIRKVIDECHVAIVLWSTRAVQSDFVMDEAEYAKAQGKLCPARIDDVALPFGFGSLHTDDLSAWDSELFDPQFQNLVRAIELRVGRKGRLGGSARPMEVQAATAEMEAFKAAQLAGNIAALRTFLSFHPRGVFAGFVRGQLEHMQAEEAPRALAPAATAARPAARARRVRGDPPPEPTPDRRLRPPTPDQTVTRIRAQPTRDGGRVVASPTPVQAPDAPTRRPRVQLGLIVLMALVLATLVASYMIVRAMRHPGPPAAGQATAAKSSAAVPAQADQTAALTALAKPLVGEWAPAGLGCDDAMTISANDGVLNTTSLGTTLTGTIENTGAGGAVDVKSSRGEFSYRLAGDTLTRISPNGEPTPMTRCPK
jgi:hypothetical protein